MSDRLEIGVGALREPDGPTLGEIARAAGMERRFVRVALAAAGDVFAERYPNGSVPLAAMHGADEATLAEIAGEAIMLPSQVQAALRSAATVFDGQKGHAAEAPSRDVAEVGQALADLIAWAKSVDPRTPVLYVGPDPNNGFFIVAGDVAALGAPRGRTA